MEKNIITNLRLFLLPFLFVSLSLQSSTVLDAEYSYRNIAAIVTNTDVEAVFGEQVENEIVSFLRTSMRFEFSDRGYLYLKEKFRPLKLPAIGDRQPNALIEPSRPILVDLEKQGVNAVIFAEVLHIDENYKINLHLTTTAKAETVFSTSVLVEDSKLLDSFTAGTRSALAQMMKAIPFDAAIIRRDGYLVVLDRGAPTFQAGQQLSTFTVETKGKDTVFEETGVIGLTQVEDNLSFGKILVERRPVEVTVGNKIRLDNFPVMQISPSVWSTGGRGIASTNSSEFEVTKGRLGVISASLGMGLTRFENKTLGGSETHVNMVYPGGVIGGEVWLTSRVTLSASMKYAFSSSKSIGGTSKEAVGSSVNDVRVLGGYRINLLAPQAGPILHFKAGYASESFAFNSASELLYTSVSYSGILLGSGITFPVTDVIGLGININTLIFPGVTETPVTSGSSIGNVSAWDFNLKGYYNYDRTVDFEIKLFFQRNGADFSGTKTRSIKVSSSSQSSKGLLFGLSYYF